MLRLVWQQQVVVRVVDVVRLWVNTFLLVVITIMATSSTGIFFAPNGAQHMQCSLECGMMVDSASSVAQSKSLAREFGVTGFRHSSACTVCVDLILCRIWLLMQCMPYV